MKPFIGCFVPKKGQAEKLNLPTYTIFKETANKKAATIIIPGEFFQKYADIAEHYFDVKIIEDAPGMDRPPINVWSTDYQWVKETNIIEYVSQEPEEPENPELVDISKSSNGIRAALLALFGRTENITKHEYSQAIDLTNDTEPSFARELAEAIARNARFRALLPERQLGLLTEIRNCLHETVQWTDITKFMDRWLDKPFAERAPAEVKPATEHEYVSLTFEQKIAVAINAPAIELDEVTPEILSDATNQRKCEYPAFIRAQKALIYIQPTLEKFSDRLLGNAIRSVDFNEDKGNVAYRRAVLDYLGVTNEDEAEQSAQNTAGVLDNENQESPKLEEDAAGTGEHTQKVTADRTIFTLDELTAGPDVKPCGRPAMSDREIEIIIAINDALCGTENIMSADDAAELIAAIGLPVREIVAVLGCDFNAVDESFSCSIEDDEIYHLTLDLLEDWNQNPEQRREAIRIGVEEWRQWEKEQAAQRCKNADPSITEMVQKAEPVNQSVSPDPRADFCGLSYHQRLTLAALQGLCANPACFGSFDDLPGMADALAYGVMSIQGCNHA